MIEPITDIENELTEEFARAIKAEHDPARPFVPFNRAHFIKTWNTLAKIGVCEAWVLKENRKPVGAIGGILMPEMIDGKKVASLAFWFVRQNQHGSFNSTRLFLTFEAWATTQRADRIVCAVCYDTLAGAQKQFLEKCGYANYETRYYKKLTPWEQKPL